MSGTYLLLKKNIESSNSTINTDTHTNPIMNITDKNHNATMIQEISQIQTTAVNQANPPIAPIYAIFFFGVIAVFSLVLALGKMRYHQRLLREKGLIESYSKKELL